MDRQSIERRDFPPARRGYDPAAVEAHLTAIADAFEAARKETRASSAAEQVREIVGAAERSAEEIRRDAAEQAREHVAAVARAAERMLERIREMEADVAELAGSARAEAVAPPEPATPAEAAPRAATAPPEATAPPAKTAPREATAPPEETGPPAATAPREETAPAEAAPGNGARTDDEEAARLVALDMALNGTPREDARRYLDEQFELADPDGLLDDVYARAGGS